MSKPAKQSFGILGFGAAACIACCIGPILAFLGGLSIAGMASTVALGGAGFVIAGVAAAAFIVVRQHRQRTACAGSSEGAVPVELTKVSR